MLHDGAVHVTWSELFDFIVSADGSRIDVYVENDRESEAVYTYLISQVISVALLQKNIESLHASAVALDAKAIVLVGDSGYGKSTLVAALLRNGASLVTDDLLVLTAHGDGYDVAPGACRFKLDPRTADLLGVTWPAVPMPDGSGKLIYMPDAATCVSDSLPLDRILLVHPHASHAALEPVAQPDATHALLAATFNPLHTDPQRLTRLLHDAQQIARHVRIERLHVPRDLELIDQVVALIR